MLISVDRKIRLRTSRASILYSTMMRRLNGEFRFKAISEALTVFSRVNIPAQFYVYELHTLHDGWYEPLNSSNKDRPRFLQVRDIVPAKLIVREARDI